VIQNQFNALSKKDYRVYPNPLNAQQTLEMDVAEKKEFRIYSSIGELVSSGRLNSNNNTIDLSLLSPNIYILNIDSHSIKLIKTE